MSAIRTNLQSARDSIAGVLGKRRQTTETELDECVQTLEEVKNACARIPSMRPRDADAAAHTMIASLGVVIERIKNRKRSPQ